MAITVDKILGDVLDHKHAAADITGLSSGGVPAGGTTNQVLAKSSGTDYDTGWVDQTGGGSGISESLAIAYSVAL